MILNLTRSVSTYTNSVEQKPCVAAVWSRFMSCVDELSHIPWFNQRTAKVLTRLCVCTDCRDHVWCRRILWELFSLDRSQLLISLWLSILIGSTQKMTGKDMFHFFSTYISALLYIIPNNQIAIDSVYYSNLCQHTPALIFTIYEYDKSELRRVWATKWNLAQK